MKIRWKILTAFILTTVLTVTVIAGVVFKRFKDYAVQAFTQEATGQLSRVDDIIAIHLSNAAKAVEYMALLPELRQGPGSWKKPWPYWPPHPTKSAPCFKKQTRV